MLLLSVARVSFILYSVQNLTRTLQLKMLERLKRRNLQRSFDELQAVIGIKGQTSRVVVLERVGLNCPCTYSSFKHQEPFIYLAILLLFSGCKGNQQPGSDQHVPREEEGVANGYERFIREAAFTFVWLDHSPWLLIVVLWMSKTIAKSKVMTKFTECFSSQESQRCSS